MKLYHVCRCCRQYYAIQQIPDGMDFAMETEGLCDGCAAAYGIKSQILH